MKLETIKEIHGNGTAGFPDEETALDWAWNALDELIERLDIATECLDNIKTQWADFEEY
jgi:hypothetical protein